MINYEHWTTSARECYMRGGICNGCFYEQFFANKPYKCRMKAAVLSLVKNVGLPPRIKTPGIYDDEFSRG